MNLPTHAQCIELFDEYDVPDNVRKHSFAVNQVAVFLARKLREKGIEIDVDLVDRASLLHDLDKIPTLKNGEHGKMSRNILSEKGYSRLGEIVKKHIFQAVLDNNLASWEDKVVCYSDKRCTEDQIVSLKERFEYGKKRYAVLNNARTEEAENLFIELEKEIFDAIGLDPEQLQGYIEDA